MDCYSLGAPRTHPTHGSRSVALYPPVRPSMPVALPDCPSALAASAKSSFTAKRSLIFRVDNGNYCRELNRSTNQISQRNHSTSLHELMRVPPLTRTTPSYLRTVICRRTGHRPRPSQSRTVALLHPLGISRQVACLCSKNRQTHDRLTPMSRVGCVRGVRRSPSERKQRNDPVELWHLMCST